MTFRAADMLHVAPDLRSLCCEVIALNPAPNNARQHSLTDDIPVLMDSLRRFGQRKPIVGKRTYQGVPDAILAGNGTLLAARQLGWEWIAVSWFEGTDEEAQEYALLDNRTAELSEWNIDELKVQMRAIRARGGSHSGWTADDVAAMITDTPPRVATDQQRYRAVTFTLEQWPVVLQAVASMRQRENDPEMSITRACELILADFNSGN